MNNDANPAHFEVYLAVAPKGVHAHILALPGCFSRGGTRQEAMEALPAAVRTYLSDLKRHGETVNAQKPFTFSIVETNAEGTGPFDPGDTAALFAPERQPVSREEIELRFLRRAGYNRADLMALIRSIHPKLLDWKPAAGAFSIRRIIRHIGSADEWYVSRVVAPDTLPPEWEHDEEMELFEFLAMSRRTALERIRDFTEDERAGRTLTPRHFTSNPKEPWTTRKALRRLLEHEREHTEQLRETLAAWRAHFLARLTAERSDFFWQYRSIRADVLTTNPVFKDWTPKDLLAHNGEWDNFHTRRMLALYEGRLDEVIDDREEGFYDHQNRALQEKSRPMTLAQTLTLAEEGRQNFLTGLAQIPDVDLAKVRAYPHGGTLAFSQTIKWRYRHDSAHTADLRNWRTNLPQGVRKSVGPKSILLAILRAAHAEITTLIRLVPAREWDTRQVEGDWTVKDVLGHITDWERIGIEWAETALRGESTAVNAAYADEDAWNDARAESRKSQKIAPIFKGFEDSHATIMALTENLSQSDLKIPLTAAWGGEETLYQWLLNWPDHKREHATAIRTGLAVPNFPERLLSK